MHQSESTKRIVEVDTSRRTSRPPSLSAVSIFLNIFLVFLLILLVVVLFHRIDRPETHQKPAKAPYKELKWMTPEDVENYETFLFDVDGTLKNYNGYFPEAMEFLNQLKLKNKTIIIVSNDDTISPEEKAQRFNIPPSNIVIPFVVMSRYAVESLRGRRVLAYCPILVKKWLKSINVSLVNSDFVKRKGEYTDPDEILATAEEQPEIIIMDSYPDYNFEIIDRIVNILERSEAKIYLLAADPVLRTKHNLLWTEVAAVYVRNFSIVGENWSRYLREHFNLEKAIMFGDSLYADMGKFFAYMREYYIPPCHLSANLCCQFQMANQISIDSCFMSLTGMNNEQDCRKLYEEGTFDGKPTYKGSFAHLIKKSRLHDH